MVRWLRPINSNSSIMTSFSFPIFTSGKLRIEVKPNQLNIRCFMFVALSDEALSFALWNVCVIRCSVIVVIFIASVYVSKEDCEIQVKSRFFFKKFNHIYWVFQLQKVLKLEQGLILMSVKDVEIEECPISEFILRIIFHASCHFMPCMSDSVCT